MASRVESDEHYVLDLCDEVLEIPAHGLRFVVIEKAAFTLRSRRIARDHARHLAVVRQHLGPG